MEVTIRMSLHVFNGLITRCDKDSREFAILENGLLIRISKEDHFERLVEIRCDIDDADRLGFLATTIYPCAVEDISPLQQVGATAPARSPMPRSQSALHFNAAGNRASVDKLDDQLSTDKAANG